MKAFEKFKSYKSKKKKKPKKKKIKVAPVKKESDAITAEPKIKLDHRNYGAWYISPNKYQKRFEELSDPKAIEIVKSRIMVKKEKQNKIDIKTDREKVIYNLDLKFSSRLIHISRRRPCRIAQLLIYVMAQ